MRVLLLCLVISCLCGFSEEPRTWFLSNGVTFKASFVSADSGKVTLMNEAKKTAGFPIKDLSIVDRAYLHQTQDVSLDELEGGNVYNPECEISFKVSEFKAGEKFQVKGDGYKVSLDSLITPHFILFYEDELEVRALAEMLERIWYSHAFRTPHFVDLYGAGRRVYFYVTEGDELQELAQYFIATQEEDLSERELNDITHNWNSEAYKVDLKVPEGFVKKYACEPTAQIQKNSSKGEYMESFLNSAPFFMWQELFLPGAGLPQNRNTSSEKRKISAQGFLALVFGNEIRLQGNENKADTGVATYALTVKYPPQGKPREWGRELITAIKEEEVKASLDVIYDEDSFAREEGSVRSNLVKTHLMMAIGRFLEKDLDHMLKRCALTEEIEKTEAFPPKERLADIYGYTTPAAMDDALKVFILEENVKH